MLHYQPGQRQAGIAGTWYKARLELTAGHIFDHSKGAVGLGRLFTDSIRQT